MMKKATGDDFVRCQECEQEFGLEEGGYYPKAALIHVIPSALGLPFGPKGEEYWACPRGHRVTIAPKPAS
jgi:hypothetical protein